MAVLSMNETTTYRWSFEEDVAHYAEAGIRAMGVWRHKLSDFGEERAADLLEESGIRVSHLFWAGGFTGSDGRTFRESVDDAADAVRTAGEIKAQSLVLYSGPRAGHTFNHARRLLREALKELTPLAAEQGVLLAVEPMHAGCAADWTFLTTLDETLAVLDAVGTDVRIVFDSYHLGLDPANVARLGELAPRLALVQLGDAPAPPNGEQNRCRLGEGIVPLAEIVARLKAAGYDGYYDVELLGEALETTDYRELLDHARRAYAELVGDDSPGAPQPC